MGYAKKQWKILENKSQVKLHLANWYLKTQLQFHHKAFAMKRRLRKTRNKIVIQQKKFPMSHPVTAP